MTKVTERGERFLMFATMILINFFPITMYILPLNLYFSIHISTFLVLTLSFSLLNAILCLYHRGFVLSSDFKNLTLDESAQQCSICCQFKPERAHHCSSCKKCIKKMDHHCHWLGRCINYYNHGYFIKFLFLMFLNSIFLLCTNMYITYQILINNLYNPTSGQSFTIVITSMIAGLLFSVSGMHFCKQMQMLITNVTFLESLHCQHFGFLESDSPYNISLKYNFEDVLGPLKYCFLGKPKGNGIIFKKKYDVNYWPRHFKFSEQMYVENL